MIKFESKLEQAKKWVIVKITESASLELPSRGQVAIKGSINGKDFAEVLEPDGRWGHWFRLNNELQESLKLKVGDKVSVEIEPIKDWPEPIIPKDFKTALDNAPQSVKELWDKITPMARWEWIRWVNATNVNETRARRVEVSISKMKSGKRRPCCFNLAACTDPDLCVNSRLII